VTDDDIAGPLITLGGSSGSQNDGQTQSFTWDISDASGLSALSVVIKQGSTTIYSTTSLSDASGSFNFDSSHLCTPTTHPSPHPPALHSPPPPPQPTADPSPTTTSPAR